MCIVVVTTAHPDYAIIVLNNRDEFILRPTSRPHWWHSHHQAVLSARDLQREEQGTWIGITKTGNFAVLTNYREADSHDADHPIQGTRSRGGMVTAWLTSPEEQSTEGFVNDLLDGEGVQGVGGFSLLCGKLRKRRNSSSEIEPLAVVSNRSGSANDVPWIGEKRGKVYGLSNTSFLDETWPKVIMGKQKLLRVVGEAVEAGLDEEALVSKLYAILDTDTLPPQEGRDFEEYTYELRKSIFIPPIVSIATPKELPKVGGTATDPEAVHSLEGPNSELKVEEAPEYANSITEVYGTQRQTIILVDWEGNVTFKERALWDAHGHPIERGKGDIKFNFKIDGWSEEKIN